MTGARRTDGEPHDRLTRITDAMLETMRAHPEYREGDQGAALLESGDKVDAGYCGYESETDAMAGLLSHLQAMVEARGGKLVLMPRRPGPS